jgi:molybdopterin molybdotransferase
MGRLNGMFFKTPAILRSTLDPRPSTLPLMLELEQAVEKILASIPAPKSETVPLADAHGRVAAEKILAATDLPSFDNSAVDGYAVRAQDVAITSAQNRITLQLAGRIAAGEHFTGQLTAGHCIRIFTGSPVPAGADAVVMQEDTKVDNARLNEVQILDPARPWENIRFHGEDVKHGAVIVDPGTRLGAAHVGLLSATGIAQVTVNRRPIVALLATGSELKEPTAPAQLAPGQIFESNRAALTPLIAATGAIPKNFPIVLDTAEATHAALTRAFAECDLVITCGGVSVGEMDFVKSAFEELGGQLDFWKVAIKPGRPFVFGRLPGSAAVSAASFSGSDARRRRDAGAPREKFLFGLPGNPISAFVTFLLLARPALLRWQGATNDSLPTSLGILTEPFSNPDNRRHFVRVRINREGRVHSAGVQASHILSSLTSANGLIDIPPKTTLAAETTVKILRWE